MNPTAVQPSTAASARRNGVHPWVYLKHVLTALPARPVGCDLADLLPDGWAKAHAELQRQAG
ncbi:MAG: transposase domain-containing protein [Gemmataceae bacterium]